MADEDKLINVIVKYLTQGSGDAMRTQKELTAQIQADMTRLAQIQKNYTDGVKVNEKEADALRSQLTDNLKEYNTRFIESSEKLQEQLEGNIKSLHELRSEARELGQIGTFMTLAGGLLTAGIAADADNYVKTVGQINQYSAQ